MKSYRSIIPALCLTLGLGAALPIRSECADQLDVRYTGEIGRTYSSHDQNKNVKIEPMVRHYKELGYDVYIIDVRDGTSAWFISRVLSSIIGRNVNQRELMEGNEDFFPTGDPAVMRTTNQADKKMFFYECGDVPTYDADESLHGHRQMTEI